MKAKLPKYISFRDVPFALVFAVVWAIVLWIAEYSTSEGVGVAAIAYVALWASRWATVSATLFVATRLHKLIMETAERLGVEIPEDPASSLSNATRVSIVVFLSSAMLLSMTGLSLIVTVPTVAVAGLTPLSAVFLVSGVIMFALGAGGLALLFGIPYITVVRAETVANDFRRQESGIRATASVLSARPLKALGFAPNPNAAASR